MVLKRIVLLLIGVAGAIVPVAGLCFTTGHQLAIETSPPALVATEPNFAAATAESINKATEVETVCFPMQIPGTTLIAERICVYDGPFLEDRSQREVMNIAALQVCNIGRNTILEVNITVSSQETVLLFRGEQIPPGATVALLEREGKSSPSKQFNKCNGWQVAARSEDLLNEKIEVSDEDMGTLLVTNLTVEILRDIQVYYKCWLSTENILVGGIAYMVTVPILKPGETVSMHPKYYASGYSKVVRITTAYPG